MLGGKNPRNAAQSDIMPGKPKRVKRRKNSKKIVVKRINSEDVGKWGNRTIQEIHSIDLARLRLINALTC